MTAIIRHCHQTKSAVVLHEALYVGSARLSLVRKAMPVFLILVRIV